MCSMQIYFYSFLMLPFSVSACGTKAMTNDGHDLSDSALSDLGIPSDGNFAAAAHESLPSLPKMGNGILPSLRLVTIVTPQETYATELHQFGDQLVQGTWYSSFAGEYGLGTPTSHVFLTGPALGSYPSGMLRSDVQNYIAQVIIARPEVSPNGSTVYLVYLPDGVIFDPSQSSGTGHHFQLAGSNGTLGDSGAAIQRTPNVASVIDWLTMIAAHEVAEAVTDSGGGWGRPTGNGYVIELGGAMPWNASVWIENEVSNKSEVGDLCDGTRFTLGGFAYQRIFSNTANALGGDPCVPALSIPYFSISAPHEWYSAIAGQGIDISVTGWSTGPTDDWEVQVFTDSPQLQQNFTATLVSTTTAKIGSTTYPTLNNGVTAVLHVQPLATAASGWWGVVLLNSRHFDPSMPGHSILTEDVYHQAVIGIYIP